MSAPAFEVIDSSAVRPPLRAGWLILWVLVALLVASQLAEYIRREPGQGVPYAKENEELRMAVTVAEAENLFAATERTGGKVGAKKSESLSSLDGTISELAGKRKADPSAALLYAAMRTEQSYALAAEDVKALFESKKQSDLAAAQVYVAKSLTPDGARSLASQMNGSAFVWRLARIHAFEKAGDSQIRRREIPAAKLLLFVAITGLLFAAVFLGGILLLLFAAGSRAGRIKPKGFPLGELSAGDADRCAMRTAQLLLVFVITGIGTALFLGSGTPQVVRVLAAGGIGLALALLLFLLPVGGKRISLSVVGLRSDRPILDVLWGLSGAFANAPLIVISIGLTVILQRFMPAAEHPISAELARASSFWSAAGYLVSAAVLAPIFEEICFRGVLMPALASALRSPAWGIVVSSLVFAAVHPTGVPAWPGLAVIVATSGVLAYQTRSLIPSIVMHAVHNGTLLLFYFSLA